MIERAIAVQAERLLVGRLIERSRIIQIRLSIVVQATGAAAIAAVQSE